jgi:membrane protein YqaA with SNARE-associated domain
MPRAGSAQENIMHVAPWWLMWLMLAPLVVGSITGWLIAGYIQRRLRAENERAMRALSDEESRASAGDT